MTSREQFDEFVRENLHPGASNAVIRLCWSAWQASRAAIEIELPELDIGYDMMEYFEPKQVIEAIESAGLKVKK